MSIKELPIYKKAKKHISIDLGDLYFFENYLITEFKEGVEINYNNFETVREYIRTYFGETDFGLISHRINSYSIVITDAPLFNACKSLKAYATVTYTLFAEKVFNVESYFFKFNKQNFSSISDAEIWVQNTLNSEKSMLN